MTETDAMYKNPVDIVEQSSDSIFHTCPPHQHTSSRGGDNDISPLHRSPEETGGSVSDLVCRRRCTSSSALSDPNTQECTNKRSDSGDKLRGHGLSFRESRLDENRVIGNLSMANTVSADSVIADDQKVFVHTS
jgi:hypothetical protein